MQTDANRQQFGPLSQLEISFNLFKAFLRQATKRHPKASGRDDEHIELNALGQDAVIILRQNPLISPIEIWQQIDIKQSLEQELKNTYMQLSDEKAQFYCRRVETISGGIKALQLYIDWLNVSAPQRVSEISMTSLLAYDFNGLHKTITESVTSLDISIQNALLERSIYQAIYSLTKYFTYSANTLSVFLNSIEGKTKRGLPVPDTQDVNVSRFERLFKNVDDIEPCINALKRYRPERPIINDKNEWTGGVKDRGVIVAWIERLENTGKIMRLSDRKKLVNLLNTYIKDLNMGQDARVFGNPVDGNKAAAFFALIPQ